MTPNSIRGKRGSGYLAILALLALFAARPSPATVLLDTYAPGNSTPGRNYQLTNAGGNGQSLGVPFSTGSTVTVGTILAAISGTGSVMLGIMANAAGDVPSNTYLHSVTLTDPSDVLLSGLNWSLPSGSYWLVAIGIDTFNGNWPGGDTFTDFAFTQVSGPVDAWIHFSTELPDFAVPAARISTMAAPEPAALALIGAGLLSMVLIRRRFSPAEARR